jgi:hypothetical protein
LGLRRAQGSGFLAHVLSKKVVLHNAQIDKTVMIHDWLAFNHYVQYWEALLDTLMKEGRS